MTATRHPLLLLLLTIPRVAAEPTPVPMPNSDFEKGASGWAIPEGSPFASISEEQAASGKRSLKITDAETQGGSNVNGPLVPVPSAGLYEVRGKVYPVSGSGLGIYLRLLGEDGKGLPGDPHLLGLGGSEQTWKPFSATLMVPPAAKQFQFWIHSYQASVVTAYLDDLEIVLVKSREDGLDMEEDLKTIKQRLHAMALGGGDTFDDVPKLMAELQPDGTWADIDYGDRGRARWRPAGHVSRVYRMAQAYAHPDSPLHGKPELKEAMLRAYDYWTHSRPKCPNWWYNVIGVPRTLFRAMLLIEDELSAEQFAAGLKVLEDAKLGMTGQNLVWVAEVNIARGCLAKDAWLVWVALNEVSKEIRITTGEGIQPDFSFHQHGTQLYSGGYGRGFASDCPRFAVLVRGTEFQFSDEKLDILSGYLLDGQQWMVRGATFDHSACGREISRKGASRSRSLIGACSDMAQLDTPRKAEFEAFLARLKEPTPANALVGNKHFWRSDYMTHHRPGFMASVRMTSPRTLQTEQCNSENLLGAHLSDGLMYLYQRGDEYQGIFPVWDWKRLPGVTAELDGKPPVTKNGQRGKRSFVGGVSDGQCGLAAMDFARGKLTAKKSWFFVGDEIVCLGAGINCPTEHETITSVNQCLLKGDVRAGADQPLQRGERQLRGPAWVHHDGVGYVFPTAAEVTLKNEAQTGSWYVVSNVHPKGETTEDVFSLWLSHGVGASDASYQYVVLPGVTPEELAARAGESPIEVLANTAELQAVRHRELGVTAVSFYEPGAAKGADVVALSVDKPCLVLMRETEEGITLAVSNPENEPLEVTVSVGAELSGEGCAWSDDDGVTRVSFTLPEGKLAGASVVRTLSAKGR